MSTLSRCYRKKGGKRPMSMRKRGGKSAMSMKKRGGGGYLGFDYEGTGTYQAHSLYADLLDMRKKGGKKPMSMKKHGGDSSAETQRIKKVDLDESYSNNNLAYDIGPTGVGIGYAQRERLNKGYVEAVEDPFTIGIAIGKDIIAE